MVTIATAGRLYLQSLQATGHSPYTLHTVACCLRLLILHTGNIGIDRASQQAVAFLAKRATEVKPNSLCVDFSHTKTFLLYCVRQGWLDRSPLDGMKGPRKELVVTQPLSDVEIFAILKAANQWERAMIVLLLGTGMRIGELAALRWEDVGEGVLLLHGKGNKQRMVAPGVAAMRELMRLPRAALGGARAASAPGYSGAGRASVPPSTKVFPFTRGAIMARLHRLARRSCPFHPHQFRHTYAHTLLRAGAGIEDLAEILGHVSIETTRTYLRAYRRERMLEAMVRWNPADALFTSGKTRSAIAGAHR